MVSGRNPYHLVHLNISTLLEETEALLTEHMARKQERVTGPKLVELMSSNRGIQQTAASLFGRSPVRVFYEHFVAWSLVNRWLKLEFHYTPYSTVCYVVPVDRRVEDSGDLFMPYLVLNGKRKQKQEPNGDATKKRRKTEVFDMQSVETVELDSD
ncbi:unnamed protein product [Calicophoron daubneyi]|uniref:Uncharacterized protein n=1 Tax=Calicophoron daubneyi TaxID=300641 RepID=A0AAV2T3E4_CALDB